jgi:hypothetical protein
MNLEYLCYENRKSLIGWPKNGVSNEELLRRGMEPIEGPYAAVS